MHTRGMASFPLNRASGLMTALALAAGVLIGGQVDITSTLPHSAAAPQEAAPSQVGTLPLFIIGDADGVFHQQHVAASVAGGCDASSAPLFIGGDSDGLANPALNAALPTSSCGAARH
jgi:hypothetical protein